MARRSDRQESGGGGPLIHRGGHRGSSVGLVANFNAYPGPNPRPMPISVMSNCNTCARRKGIAAHPVRRLSRKHSSVSIKAIYVLLGVHLQQSLPTGARVTIRHHRHEPPRATQRTRIQPPRAFALAANASVASPARCASGPPLSHCSLVFSRSISSWRSIGRPPSLCFRPACRRRARRAVPSPEADLRWNPSASAVPTVR